MSGSGDLERARRDTHVVRRGEDSDLAVREDEHLRRLLARAKDVLVLERHHRSEDGRELEQHALRQLREELVARHRLRCGPARAVVWLAIWPVARLACT